MTVSHKKYVIIEIEEVKKAEIDLPVIGKLLRKSELDVYRIKAVLKEWITKTEEGYKMIEKLGHGDKMDKLTEEYLKTAEAFTATVPVTSRAIEWNKYHLGGDIIISYYPDNVWATFHTEGQPDNNNDKKRMEKEDKI